MDDIDRVIAGLSEAQRDTLLGHMVEIPPHEYDELIELGLKGPSFKEKVCYERTVYPITETGLAVRARLLGDG